MGARCAVGRFHRWRIVEVTAGALLARCSKCGQSRYLMEPQA